MINAPSLANCDFFTLSEQVDELIRGGATALHVDIMDGHYVPNLCFPVSFIRDLKRHYPETTVDAHLMVDAPTRYFGPLADAKADYVSFPADSTNFARRAISAARDLGLKVGVAINPSDRVDRIAPYAGLLDYVILMTVEPGWSGQRFLEGSLERVDELARLREQTTSDFLIEIDGGVDYAVGEECLKRGADILVTGIYAVFGQPEGIVAATRRFNDAMLAVTRSPRN